MTIGVLLNYDFFMPSKKHKPWPELGKLERAVLEHLWKVGEADVVETHRAVGARREITVRSGEPGTSGLVSESGVGC